MNQPCLTLLAATDRDLLSLLDAHLARVTDSLRAEPTTLAHDRIRLSGGLRRDDHFGDEGAAGALAGWLALGHGITRRLITAGAMHSDISLAPAPKTVCQLAETRRSDVRVADLEGQLIERSRVTRGLGWRVMRVYEWCKQDGRLVGGVSEYQADPADSEAERERLVCTLEIAAGARSRLVGEYL